MLTRLDDYPLHQTAEPIAQPATGDRNFYDRYFFNGYNRAGDLFFAAALGVYPNRRVMDAAFSVVHGGTARSGSSAPHAWRRSSAPRPRSGRSRSRSSSRSACCVSASATTATASVPT